MNIQNLSMVDLSHQQQSTSTKDAFAKHVDAGLKKNSKALSSRYFYDAKGSTLFQRIMELPEYYLTRSEFEIFSTHAAQITAAFSENGFFHLIDLGAGDALKTKILLNQLHQKQVSFEYVPVDISKDAMQQLTENLNTHLPEVEVQAVIGEYFEALQWLHEHKTARKVVLFLGSNIGNFELDDAKLFLKSIRSYLDPGDMLFLGVDLRKDPSTIIPAYADSAGITAAFNINLLERINRELGGNFNLDAFKHYASYDPQQGAMKSYLISTVKQQVFIEHTGETYPFEAWEAIHTENSYKYSLQQVKSFASEFGFEQSAIFQDKKNYFADVLFAVK